MSLSILIPTLPERAMQLHRLRLNLDKQAARFPGEVEIRIHDQGRSMTTGEKRNWLVSQAWGTHTVFFDDDDFPQPTYVEDIMMALKSDPDCVTFNGWMTTNGAHRVDFIIKLGEKYEERGGKYYRFPNHIVPIRKTIAESVKFQHISQGEDYKWAKEINDRGLIKTSVHIDKQLYHYDFIVKK